MQNDLIFQQNRKVTSAFIDSSVKMGIAQTVLMVQDNLTELFRMMKCDGVTYRDQFKVFWVFTRTKVHFNKRPAWTDEINAATFPVNNSGFRTNVNTVLKDMDGGELISANMEACVLDLESHRPVRLNTLTYPQGDFPEACFSLPFEKFSVEYTEEDFVFEQKIRSHNIDMSSHMNNNEYIKFALDIFDNDFLLAHEPENLEVHYNGESREGQMLRVYAKNMDGRWFIRILESDRNVFEMVISFYEK